MESGARSEKKPEYAVPGSFTKGVLYEFDEVDSAGKMIHRKVKATGFVLIAKDLDTHKTVQINLDAMRNLKQHTITF